MADAAATVCVSMARAGGSVTLTTPSGRVEASPGRIEPALEHLASAAGGHVPDPEADIVVVADADAVSIRFDGRERRFEGPIGDAVPLRTAARGDEGGLETGRSRIVDDRESTVGTTGADAPATATGRGAVPDGSGARRTDADVPPDGWSETPGGSG
jgi:hypothetical protein